MTLRPWHALAGFVVSFAVVLAGLAWISHTTVALDRAEAEARRRAEVEENVRLALWRMDSAVAPLIARETAQPYFAYQSFYPADRAWDRMFVPPRPSERLAPSPLLSSLPEHVNLHFQFARALQPTSPQVPTPKQRALAEERGIQLVKGADERLRRLSELIGPGAITRALGLAQVEAPNEGEIERAQAPPRGATGYTQEAQTVRNDNEWLMRARTVRQAANTNVAYKQQKLSVLAGSLDKGVGVDMAEGAVIAEEPAMTPLWVGDLLMLVRSTEVAGRRYIQGCWLDRGSLERWLLTEIGDLLPNARLVPASGSKSRARVLASLPLRLEPATDDDPVAGTSAPVELTLTVAWSGVLVAGLAVGLLLLGATSLSERRADFVSAVTHELRTPLTTFRMYTEMLADGMIADEAKRTRYLDTLRSEAIRLSHLVENVLSYARIERGRAGAKRERISIREVIERFTERLIDRAAQAGMDLEIDSGDAPLHVDADAGAVEQILFNLVDNACKYGASTEDKRIRVDATADDGWVVVTVRDHGPGVDAGERARLFAPFSKSARRAAESAPGVGLGLALCRRLARAMGGDLVLEPMGAGNAGAKFSLSLRAARGEG